MAIRGETIGTAYVRILADGTGFSDSVKRELRSADAEFSEAGEEHSKAYNKAFDKQQKKNTGIANRLKKDIDKAFGEIASDSKFLPKFQRDITDSINKGLLDGFDPDRAAKIAERAAKRVADEFARTGKLDFSVSKEIDAAIKSLEDDERRFLSFQQRLRGAMDDLNKQNAQDAADFEKRWRASFNAVNEDTRRTMRDIASNLRGGARAFEGLDNTVRQFRINYNRHLLSVRASTQRLSRDSGGLRRFVGDFDRFTNSLARGFGKGARNDLINFFGSVVGGVINLLDIVPRAILKLNDLGTAMQKNFTNAGGGAVGILAAAAGPIAALVVGIGALVLVIGAASGVAALISGIAAAVVGLAGAIGLAIAAGLGVFGALLFPLIATVGGLTLAFTNLSDAMKKNVKEAFKPFKQDLRDLQKIAQRNILDDIIASADHLHGAFRSLRPLVRGVSDAIGDVIRGFARAADSPGAREFIKLLSEILPRQIRTLGRITRQVIGGFGGLFLAAEPQLDTFLRKLDNLSERFQEFTSPKSSIPGGPHGSGKPGSRGGSTIIDFFDRAGESADALLTLIGRVSVAIGKVFFGKESGAAGNTLIDDLTTQVNNFIIFLDEHPNAVHDFFVNGIEVARELGRIAKTILEVFDALDNPEGRESTTAFLTDTATAIHGIAGGVEAVTGAFDAIGNVAKWIFDVGAWIVKLHISVTNFVVDVAKGFQYVFWTWPQRQLEKLFGFLGGLFGKFSLKDIINTDGLSLRLINPFKGHLPGILGAIGKVSLWKTITDNGLLGALLKPFRGHIDDILHAIGKVHIKDIIDPLGVIDKIMSVDWGSLAGRIKAAIGTIIPDVRLPDVNPFHASGGIFTSPHIGMIGEAGPEAVVPLNRPLGMVDPAVRALSAIAQGLSIPSQSSVNNGRSINVGGLTIITPTEDPRAVARETINRMAAATY